jgi:uncharacterized damage-inducible protein DinB
MIMHWENVRAGLLQTIDKFLDADLDFKPYPTGWSVRQIMLHIAHEEYGEFNYGILQTLDSFPPEYNLRDYPTIASIRALLEAVHAPVLDYLKTLPEDDLDRIIATPWGARYRLIEMMGHLLEHEIHHRAELSLTLGLLGREGLDA